jgi:flagellar L-ring protein FlgH
MLKTILLLIGLSVLVPMTSVRADSLWSDSAPTAIIFGDQRARAVGDILTIVVNETSTAARSGSSSNTKAAAASTDKGTGLLGFLPDSSLGQKDSFSTKGSINNTNIAKARLAVTVTEVKPNGILVVSGTQNIRQNGEEQRIVVSGLVRPADIQGDNTVQASNVADAKILFTGSGSLVSKQRQGVLTQIWNWIF